MSEPAAPPASEPSPALEPSTPPQASPPQTGPRLGAVERTWEYLKGVFSPKKGVPPEAELEKVRANTPAPVLWLFGKTQSGKSSVVRFLTGAEDAAIGNGFRPCTRTSAMFPFPTPDAPVLTFLDTRGVDEPGYDPAEDVAAFDPQAHLMLVTCRLTDFATGNLRTALRLVRETNRRRPVVLALTCLHEAYPQQQHPQPYPYGPARPGIAGGSGEGVSHRGMPHPAATASEAEGPVEAVTRLMDTQAEQFAGLVDFIVPVDLTRPVEGFDEPHYGGDALTSTLLAQLPGAYRETLRRLTDVHESFKDRHLARAGPVLVGYSTLAATAGAVPVPFIDLITLPLIQGRMVKVLAELSGNRNHANRFLEMSTTIGVGLLATTGLRQVAKLIPYVGSAVGATLAWASTYALGRAYLEYDRRVNDGHLPDKAEVAALYKEHLAAAEKKWKTPPVPPATGGAP